MVSRGEIPSEYRCLLVYYDSPNQMQFMTFYLEVQSDGVELNVSCNLSVGSNFICICRCRQRNYRVFWRIVSRYRLRYRTIRSLYPGLYVLIPSGVPSIVIPRYGFRTDPCLLTAMCTRVLVSHGMTIELIRARAPCLARYGFEVNMPVHGILGSSILCDCSIHFLNV